jgi:hypothetical protein
LKRNMKNCFHVNLRPYTEVAEAKVRMLEQQVSAAEQRVKMVGRCSLTLSNPH